MTAATDGPCLLHWPVETTVLPLPGELDTAMWFLSGLRDVPTLLPVTSDDRPGPTSKHLSDWQQINKYFQLAAIQLYLTKQLSYHLLYDILLASRTHKVARNGFLSKMGGKLS